MGKVKRNNDYFGNLFSKLYNELQTIPLNKNLLTYPDELIYFIHFIYDSFKLPHPLINNTCWGYEPPNPIETIPDNNKILIAFSGGKDSLGAVLSAIDLGYKPTLFFTKGINKSTSDEIDFAIRLANRLNIYLEIHDATINNTKNDYKENIIKNQFILACMVDYGIKNDFHRYAFGNHSEESLNDPSNLEFNFSDYIEVFTEVKKYFKIHIPNFELITLVKNDTDSLIKILSHDYTLYQDAISCMGAKMYKAGLKVTNKNNYNINLPDSWCGSCYKCAWTYILLSLVNIVDNQYYIAKCFDILKDKTGIRYPNHIDFSKNGLIKRWYNIDMITDFKTNHVLISEINSYFRSKNIF